MYQQNYQLSIRDINYANHMDHLALLNYLHETRVRFLREHGYSELDVDGKGSGLVVADLQCSYRRECFYGDTISVSMQLKVISPTRLILLYTIHKDDGVLVASAEIRVAFINSVRKVIAIPEYLVSIASRLSIS
ncbi:MAG: acyl-CoA thioesterase [Burkholderiales bacterium]|jgi:YbgC/YbaW family acyl-CoA thioester hydrolase|nr:acyl-CoA thioesterase [Burkholderiales bacterium]